MTDNNTSSSIVVQTSGVERVRGELCLRRGLGSRCLKCVIFIIEIYTAIVTDKCKLNSCKKNFAKFKDEIENHGAIFPSSPGALARLRYKPQYSYKLKYISPITNITISKAHRLRLNPVENRPVFFNAMFGKFCQNIRRLLLAPPVEI